MKHCGYYSFYSDALPFLLRCVSRVTAVRIISFLVAVLFVFGTAGMAYAEDGAPSKPPSLHELEMIESMGDVSGEKMGLPYDIRGEALKEAAISYGARGGLAWRTYHIRKEIDGRARYLDGVFDFRSLLVPAPSGFLIEPPVITEAVNSMIIEASGQEAAVSDRIYDMIATARIVSAARHWRNYLERDWGDVTPPPDILRPKSAEERKKWIKWINQGWEQGVEQADEIFQEDLDQLVTDYQGMVRYRMLLTQGMVSPPYAMQLDRGITSSGNRLRVGDRAVQITGTPEFIAESELWQPANR